MSKQSFATLRRLNLKDWIPACAGMTGCLYSLHLRQRVPFGWAVLVEVGGDE
ncbi:hypothetical protein V22_36660 [Calycomorphotria hydatis]|uniref:Uncharacterized protein n=1 Tax=Calycomorphotria hydatis TaxID=2528027 RepID=A0A517TDG1_9PLAN|nr:hypothetical protein V22_36660 [Calycomorphotria hydatis]